MLRVAASRRFLWLALGGLVAVCVVALDVPQGVSDAQLVARWPLSVGPFVALFELNNLGRSLAVWSWVALLAAHAVAVVVVRRAGPAGSDDGPETPSAALPG